LDKDVYRLYSRARL